MLNSADPDAPSGLEIARTIARLLDVEWEEVLLDETPTATSGVTRGTLATRSCSTPPPRSRSATCPSATTRPPSPTTVDWLVTAARGGADADRLPRDDDPFFAPLLDYAAEDRFLAARQRVGGGSTTARRTGIRRAVANAQCA